MGTFYGRPTNYQLDFLLTKYTQYQSKDILYSLYLQVLWLEENDERHILANHYFENLKTLTFAGGFFRGNDAERWLKKGCKGIERQIVEQTLDDGGHYERTPQYHGLMLENYLDLYNLALSNSDLFDTDFKELLNRHCIAGLKFHQAILFPDQKIPLFNDSAFGISPSLSELDSYYQRICGKFDSLEKRFDQLIDLKSSGFFGYRSGRDMFVIDAGDIGPSYQPGHTHCDMLSYELMLAGRRVVVDSGVFEYEPGLMRQYVRSTRAHNSVSVDEKEQSEVWGEFRVARRAKILNACIEMSTTKKSNILPPSFISKKNNSNVCFKGEYAGFHSVKRRIRHQRVVVIELNDTAGIRALNIIDTINGCGVHKVESFIHLHPDIKMVNQSDAQFNLIGMNCLRMQLLISENASCFFERSYYCPEFGKKISNGCIVLQVEGLLPCQLAYTLKRIDRP